jgi:AcrR family transcriptional regulator
MTDVGTSLAAVEARVLDATKLCCERYGFHKTSIDDVASLAGVSRATVYRLFPGGKDVLFEALRVRELEEFFDRLREAIYGAGSLEELLVRTVVAATGELRADEHLAVMLATEPGEALSQLTMDGVPRILRFATTFLVPFAEPYLTREQATVVVDVLARLTISYFLAPSNVVDLGDTDSARAFLTPVIDVLTQVGLHPDEVLQPN